jgi:hypothetical protein
MTKKLKQIIITAINESKKNTAGSGIAPSPVHFRMGYDSIDKRKSKHLKSSLKEETSPVKTEDWLGKNENAGRSVHKITKELLDDADPISKEHAETLRYYSGPDSAVINKKLIDDHYGKKPDSSGSRSLPKEYIEKTVKHLDKITSHNIRRQLHVYSGLGFDPSKHVDSQGHLHMPAFTSVTHDKNVAHEFAETHHKEGRTQAKHILHIHLKSYDRATHISGHAFVPDEHESILPRNTILKVHPVPTMLSDGTHVWHAQVHRQD